MVCCGNAGGVCCGSAGEVCCGSAGGGTAFCAFPVFSITETINNRTVTAFIVCSLNRRGCASAKCQIWYAEPGTSDFYRRSLAGSHKASDSTRSGPSCYMNEEEAERWEENVCIKMP